MILSLFLIFIFQVTLAMAQESLPALDNVEIYRTDQINENLNLTKYFPIYLLYSTSLTKLQFSFKYQMISSTPIYFAYTQLIFWDLNAESKPIYDINYAPEFFYRQIFDDTTFKSIDFSPLSHFSNGLTGFGSRGYNRIFAQLNMLSPLFVNTLSISTRLSYFYSIEDTNSNIVEHVSPLDLKFTLTHFFPGLFDRGEFYLRIFPGGKYANNWADGGQEIGLSFRPGGINLQPSIFIQYYGGYAESLLDYARPQSVTRIGIIF